MAFELVYTSVPNGVKLGSSGFCTVAYTNGLAANLANQLERMSAYKPFFPHYDEHAAENPVAYTHYIVAASGVSSHILSRTCFYGLDYTKRSNKLAHHVVLTNAEASIPAGPAAVGLIDNFFRTEWNEEPQLFSQQKTFAAPSADCHVASWWAAYTGDAGWAGTLAQNFLDAPAKPVYVIYDPLKHKNILNLVEEAIQLLPVEKRWQVSYNTYFYSVPAGVQCNWRFCVADPDVLREVKRIAGTLVIDLTKAVPPAGDGKLQEIARTGVRPEPPVKKELVMPPAPDTVNVNKGPAISHRAQGMRIAPEMRNTAYTRQYVGEQQPYYQSQSQPPQSSSTMKYVLLGVFAFVLILVGGMLIFSKTIMKQMNLLPPEKKEKVTTSAPPKDSPEIPKRPSVHDALMEHKKKVVKQPASQQPDVQKKKAKKAAAAPAPVKKKPAPKKTAPAPARPVKKTPSKAELLKLRIKDNQQAFWLNYYHFAGKGTLSQNGKTYVFKNILSANDDVAEVYVYNTDSKQENKCEKTDNIFFIKEEIAGFGSGSDSDCYRARYVFKRADNDLTIRNINQEAKVKNYPITKIILRNGVELYCSFVPGKSRCPDLEANGDIISLQSDGTFLKYQHVSRSIQHFMNIYGARQKDLTLHFRINGKEILVVDRKFQCRKHLPNNFPKISIYNQYLIVRMSSRIKGVVDDRTAAGLIDKKKLAAAKKKLEGALKAADAKINKAKDDKKKKAATDKKNEIQNKLNELAKIPGSLKDLKFALLLEQELLPESFLARYDSLMPFFQKHKDKPIAELEKIARQEFQDMLKKEKNALEKIRVEVYFKANNQEYLLHKKAKIEVKNGK